MFFTLALCIIPQILGIFIFVHINKNRPEDLFPLTADVIPSAAVVVRIKQLQYDRSPISRMAGIVLLCRTAAEVFIARRDHPHALLSIVQTVYKSLLSWR